ncbi:MAG: ABC transporter permease [Nocardioides sp.]
MRILELLAMSTASLLSSKLRSVLTLVGIVAGVASIIAVMTAIAVVQSTMEKEMSVLGAQVFQVQKWPAGFNSPEQRRRAMRRPPLTMEDADAIREQVGSVDLVGAELWEFGYKVEYEGEETNPNISIVGGTPEYPANNTHVVGLGRNISAIDVRSGRPRGGDRPRHREEALSLRGSGGADGPAGRSQVRGDRRLRREEVGLRVGLRQLRPRPGDGIPGYLRPDDPRRLPALGEHHRAGEVARRDRRCHRGDPRRCLRRVRGVRPGEENNFDFFNSQSLITQFNTMTAKVKVAAFLIGIVALVVAGIGIMNIMLVAVTSRPGNRHPQVAGRQSHGHSGPVPPRRP